MSRILPAATASLALAALLLPADAEAIELLRDDEKKLSMDFTGYAQPYFRFLDDPRYRDPQRPETFREIEGTDGFGLERANLTFRGQSTRLATYEVEIRTIPNVELFTVKLVFPLTDGLKLNVGRFKAPFSRQELTSESRLQLIDRAMFIKSTPGRQLGASLAWDVPLGGLGLPRGALIVDLGVFNGESEKERLPINNIDEEFLYIGRIQFQPFGALDGLWESDIRPVEERHKPFLSVGANWGLLATGEANENYRQQQLGADLLAFWHGASLYAEGYLASRDYRGANNRSIDFEAIGYNVQAGFLVPWKPLREHLEIAARWEHYDPRIAVREADEPGLLPDAPGWGPVAPGSTQAQDNLITGVNWYFDGHDLKLQANWIHRMAAEDWSGSQQPATGAEGRTYTIPKDIDDDAYVLQLTYRF